MIHSSAEGQIYEQEGQGSPFRASRPSCKMIGTMTRAARGSAHHHPRMAFNKSPPTKIADRYAQMEVCRESTCKAALLSWEAVRTFRLGKQRHDNQRKNRDCDTDEAAVGLLFLHQCLECSGQCRRIGEGRLAIGVW